MTHMDIHRIGTMTLELGDASTIRCISSDLICEMEFQTKGFFSGECNSVVGKIKKESTQEILYEISGQWSGKLFINKYVAPEKNTIGGILVCVCTKYESMANLHVP